MLHGGLLACNHTTENGFARPVFNRHCLCLRKGLFIGVLMVECCTLLSEFIMEELCQMLDMLLMRVLYVHLEQNGPLFAGIFSLPTLKTASLMSL